MEIQNRVGARWIATGALLAALAVILGAYGAHGLAAVVESMDESAKRLANWETAAHYQMIHSVGLIAIGLLAAHYGGSRLFTAAGCLFLLGILLFSGGLYTWVLTDNRPAVLVVPLGGLSFILGWLAIACRFLIIAGRGSDR
ncbi:MAG: DUF423 domain-containing protein [Mariniblastus sp.]|nr:DUF423 domain-containing protein [Mariniblastus sp.]